MSDSGDLAPVSIVISEPDDKELNSALPEASAERSEAPPVSKQPSLSNSTDLPAKLSHSNKSSSETCNVSKEKQPNKARFRVVQSRIRGGLSGSKNSSNSKNGSSSNFSNNSSNGMNTLNCTLVGSLSSSNSTGKNKTVRGASSLRLGGGKSVNNVAKATGSTGRSTANLASQTRPAKSTTTLAVQPKTNSGHGSSKLHSTVLAERTLLGSTHNLFSTTLVSGMGPGGKKLVSSKKFEMTSAALPELPDISAIRLESVSSDKSCDTTILSAASEKDSSQESSSGSIREVTLDDLQKEYLRYLQSSYIDAISEDAFNRQIDELKTQLVFLDQLTSEKQSEVSDRKKKLELIRHHQNVYETYKEQTEQLSKLVDGLPATEEKLNVLTLELEKNLHQVKMDNLYVPENHKAYRDELSDALQSQITSLEELENLVEPRSQQLTSSVNLLDDLQNNTQRIQQYEREVNQAARLAIQEASLLIGAKQMNDGYPQE